MAVKPVPVGKLLPPLPVPPQAVMVPSDLSAANAESVAETLMKLLPPVNGLSPLLVAPQVAMVPSARSAAKPLGLA